MKLSLSKIVNSFSGTIEIGGSKSISNRLLIIKGLTKSKCKITNLSDSDDSISLLKYIDKIETCERSGIPMVIDVGNAGTVARFLTSYLAFRDGTWLITGTKRMQKRPMGGIVDGLLHLGAKITYEGEKGFLPIRIVGNDIRGKEVTIDVSESSQFISSLMLIAPLLENGLTIKYVTNPVSMPYIEMTQKIMQKFGAHINMTNVQVTILQGNYEFHPCTVEPDWSSVSYWYQCVALSNKAELFLPGYNKNSLQGDSRIANIFEELGVRTEYKSDGIKLSNTGNVTSFLSYDFNGSPDIVPTVMATCAALKVDAEFLNIDHLEHKESNRIESMRTELDKLGCALSKQGSCYNLKTVGKPKENLVFNTYNDHRIAMCLAPLVLVYGSICIENPEIVNKSYPSFWDDFKKLNFAQLEKTTTNKKYGEQTS